MPTRRYEINLVVQTQQNQAQQQLNAVAASVQALNRQLAATTAGILTIHSAWQTAMSAANAYREKLKELDEQSRKMAQAGLTKQQQLGEYGYLLGVPNDQALRKKVDAFGSKTGLDQSGQIGFLTQFESTAGQYRGVGKGQTMAAGQVEKYQELVGKQAASMHIDPRIVADLGGAIMGSTDWNKEAAANPGGGDAATQAFTQMAQVLKVLAVGRGENKRLIYEMVKALTMQVNINREEGVMQGKDAPVKVAALLSTVAEMNPQESGTYFSRGVEGVRMINKKKAAPWYKKAGIDLTLEPEQAIEQLGDYYTNHPEIHLPGEKFSDFLSNRMGIEFRRSKGLGAMYSGIKKGVYAHRMGVAAALTGDKAKQDLEERTEGNVTFEAQRAEQQVAEASNEQGDSKQRLSVLRDRAKTILKKKYDFGDTHDPRARGLQGWARSIYNNTAGNFFGKIDDNADLDAALISMLAAKGERMGTTMGSMNLRNLGDPGWREDTIRRLAGMAENKTGKTAEQLLEDILKALIAQKEQHAAGVPNNGQQGGMIKP